jgi:hypothetical protein
MDSGVTWTPRAITPGQWRAAASSADGTKLVAVDYPGGPLVTSTDSGLTWTTHTTRAWNGVASSVDGSKLVAVVDGGQIYTSVPAAVSSTTSGTAGYLQGGQNAAIELQYTGNGQFIPLSYAGTISAY